MVISYHDIMSIGKVTAHFFLQQSNEIRVHETVVVRNAQHDDFLAVYGRFETLLNLGPVLALHCHDDVGPLDLLSIEGVFSIIVGAG